MKIFFKLLLFIFNLIIGIYICYYLPKIDIYESCGFEDLSILKHIYVYFFLIYATLFIIATYYRSIIIYSLQVTLMSMPFSLGVHGICGHTSYTHLIGLLFIQVSIPFSLSIYELCKRVSVPRVIVVLTFSIVDLYVIIYFPSIMYKIGG